MKKSREQAEQQRAADFKGLVSFATSVMRSIPCPVTTAQRAAAAQLLARALEAARINEKGWREDVIIACVSGDPRADDVIKEATLRGLREFIIGILFAR